MPIAHHVARGLVAGLAGTAAMSLSSTFGASFPGRARATAKALSVDAYLAELVARLRAVVGDRLLGVYAIGSLALGDYRQGSSDLDVAAVTAEPPSAATREAIVAALEHRALPCPARGLEFVLYASGAAPEYAINLNTGAGMEHHVSFDPRADPRFWFVLDVAIARDHARVLFGAPPRDAFPAVPPDAVRAALAQALAWYRDSGGADAQTVLAACRALRWQADGVWTSKGDAARWALDHTDDARIVDASLRVREAGGGAVDAVAARRFVDAVLARLQGGG